MGAVVSMRYLGLRRGLRMLDHRRRSSIAVSPSPCGKHALRSEPTRLISKRS